MVAIGTLLFVLLLSLIVVRIATEALVLTGLSRQVARFQARSAWTGTGFTTSESEALVKHRTRREIVSALMFVRGVGLVAAASTLAASFTGVQDRRAGLLRLSFLVLGLLLLLLLARSPWVGRRMSQVIASALRLRTGRGRYAALLHLGGDYAVMEADLDEILPRAGERLREAGLQGKSVVVLGIARRDGTYVGSPDAEARLARGDRLVLYGPSLALLSLERNSTGGTDRT